MLPNPLETVETRPAAPDGLAAPDSRIEVAPESLAGRPATREKARSSRGRGVPECAGVGTLLLAPRHGVVGSENPRGSSHFEAYRTLPGTLFFLRAEVFGSAEEFLALGGFDTPACVVADFRMAGGSGLDLKQRLTERGSTMPVLLITALDKKEMRQRARDADVAGFLRKPVDDQASIDAIE